jgi:hypothetical protein
MAVLLTCMCQNTRVKPGALQQNVVFVGYGTQLHGTKGWVLYDSYK